jgi:Dehydrogenases with different specificities (related to short-chain alcohol dehydrogenases)
MLCRSKERAEKARDEIVQMTSNSNVKVLLADVGELSQVKAAVEELQTMESQIDCLICNAGKLLNEKHMTLDGEMESTFASHLLGGSYFLTKLLTPQLQASAKNGRDPRVIYVTSGGMYTSKFPSWDVATNTAQDQKYDGVMAYTYAKRGQVILAEELAKKDKDGILYLTAHPGWTDTQAVDDAFGENKKMFEPLRDVWEGAEGIAWLMGASANALENGAFYLDRKVQPKHLAGAFMTEGSFTKNTQSEMEDMMTRLGKACGIV